MPRVSVVITFLNSERFLADAIESVIEQDFQDWELLLVDDGSTDRSVAIAARYVDHRTRLLAHPCNANRGISASRNLGVRHASGELIALLDSDDVWFPGKLCTQVALLDQFPEAAMVYSSAERWHSWNGSGIADFVVPNTAIDTLLQPPAVLAAYLRDESLAPCTCTAIIRRTSFVAAAGFRDDFPGLYDDQVFFAKLLLANPVYVMREATARYRQHARSTCALAREDGSGPDARRHFLTWLLDYLPADPGEIRAIAEEEFHRLARTAPATA